MSVCWRRQWTGSLEVWPSTGNTKTLPSYSVSCKVIHSFDILKYLAHISNITIPSNFPTFAVKKGDVYSAKVLKALENIDDECDENGIIFIKVGLTSSQSQMSSPLGPRLEKSRKQQVLASLTCRHLSILNQMSPTSTQGISGIN